MDTSNKSERKPHWTDDIKFHNPDYKWGWASAVFSWKIVGIFVGFWILLNILPWQTIGQIPGYSELGDWVNKLIPQLEKIPAEYRYDGLKEQLTIINFLGLVYLVFCLITTGNIYRLKSNPWWSPVVSGSLWTLLFLLAVVGHVSWGEVTNSPWNDQNTSEWRMTLEFVFIWYGTGMIFVFMISSFRTSVSQFYNFLRKK